MKPTVIHIFDHFHEGGTEFAILDIIKAGFYDHVDLHVIGLCRGHGPVYEQFRELLGPEKVKCLFPNHKDAAGLKTLGKAITYLISEFARKQPQTVVMSLELSNFVGRTAAMLFPNIKAISFEHMIYYSAKRSMLLRATASRVDALFADSAKTAEVSKKTLYLGSAPTNQHTHVVPISMLPCSPAREPRSPQTFEVLSVGRFNPVKNYPALVEAVAGLIKKGIDINLTIVGEGDDLQKTRALAQQLGIADRVNLPGHVRDKSVLNGYRQKADIYIQPSLHEGLCRTVTEALAAGLPTIATAVGGILDYGPQASIIMMDKPDVPTMQKSLMRLIDNYPDIAHGMSQKAVTTAAKLFNLQIAQRAMQPAQYELTAPRLHEDPSRFAELGKCMGWLRHLCA